MFVAVAISIPVLSAKGNNGPESGVDGIKVTVTVDFGRVSKNCKGFGVCDITIDIEYESARLPGNRASGQVWMENGRLRMEINRGSMSTETYQTYLSSGSLRVEEDFTLPAAVASALGVRSYTIKAGNYATTQSESQGSILNVSF